MKAEEKSEEYQPAVSPEQLLYARCLAVGVKLALVALVAGFAAYATGILPATVAMDRLPELWNLPVTEYTARAGLPRAESWSALFTHGDMLALASIAFLISISTICLLFLLRSYAARRDWTYFAVVLAEIGVVALAASGIFTRGH